MTSLKKYYKYLNINHSWSEINCLTLIELIYKDELKIDFQDTWLRTKPEKIDKNWFKIYGTNIFQDELKHWINIPLTNLMEYDILVYTTKEGIPVHFGM